MTYLLDTNVVIDVLRQKRPAVTRRFKSEARRKVVALSSLVIFELYYGSWKGRNRDAELKRVGDLVTGEVEVLPFDGDDAEVAGRIRADLAKAGTQIGPYNLLIGAQALRRDLTLVTADTTEFSRIDGLKLESWR